MRSITNQTERSGTPLIPSQVTSPTSSSELAVAITFGLCAVAGTAVTLWQAHRLWRTFRHHRREDDAASTVDVELASVVTTSSIIETATANPTPDNSTAGSIRSGQDQIG